MKKLTLLNIILLLTCSISVASTEISSIEKKALIELYHSTDGENWTKGWDLDSPVSTWRGVIVQKNHVISLNLFHNNLSGYIPESIGSLEKLEELNLAFNNITGALPKNIVKLKCLRVVKLEMNRIKGSLPEGIGKLHSLEEFSMFNNFLNGPIPESFGNITTLKKLNLSSNNLSLIHISEPTRPY